MADTAKFDTKTEAARNAERREKYHEGDIVVVGAGVFGCAIAYALANQGRSVILLERWMQEPDRIVGELLQPGGVEALRKLGLEKCLEGIDAVACHGYHVLFHEEEVVFPYPVMDDTGRVQNIEGEKASGHANGNVKHVQRQRPEGRSFHHGRFIMQLRKVCAAHPNISIFETTVENTVVSEHTGDVVGVQTETTDKTTKTKSRDCFFAPLTIIADGYASKFRKDYLPLTPIVRSKFYALELIDCPFPPSNYGHVVIGSAMPVLLYQIGTHETRALIDVPTNLPAASPSSGGVRGYILNIVVPSLPPSVRPSVLAALADGRIPKSMPNSYLPATRQETHRGILLLGDAYNMRHPLTGGGMTVAFNDALLLSSLLHPSLIPSLDNHTAIRSAMSEFYTRRKALTSIINTLAQALYSLFAAESRYLRALQAGCFRYFEMGITDEPVAMLGGMLRRPGTLAYHFFRVAFVAIWVNTLEICSRGRMWRLPVAVCDAVMILWTASVVFLPTCWMELR